MQNEQNIFGIPVTKLSTDPVRNKNGIYYNFKGFNVFVPDEADDAYTDKKTNGLRHFQLIDNIGTANGVE